MSFPQSDYLVPILVIIVCAVAIFCFVKGINPFKILFRRKKSDKNALPSPNHGADSDVHKDSPQDPQDPEDQDSSSALKKLLSED